MIRSREWLRLAVPVTIGVLALSGGTAEATCANGGVWPKCKPLATSTTTTTTVPPTTTSTTTSLPPTTTAPVPPPTTTVAAPSTSVATPSTTTVATAPPPTFPNETPPAIPPASTITGNPPPRLPVAPTVPPVLPAGVEPSGPARTLPETGREHVVPFTLAAAAVFLFGLALSRVGRRGYRTGDDT